MAEDKIKIIRATTIPMSLKAFCDGMLKELSEKYEVVAVSSPGEDLDFVAEREGVRTIAVPMERHISLFKDMKSLIRMIGVFIKEKPYMVHSMTPKAGLTCMVAGWLTGVPVRVHTFTGLVWPTSTGLKRRILMLTDKILCACATHIIPEGQGVMDDLRNGGITKKPMKVLGYGNVKGVDMEYFDPKRYVNGSSGSRNSSGSSGSNSSSAVEPSEAIEQIEQTKSLNPNITDGNIRGFCNISEGEETRHSSVSDNPTGGVQIRQQVCSADSSVSGISDGQHCGGIRETRKQGVQELPIYSKGILRRTAESSDESSRCELHNGRDLQSDVCGLQETVNSDSKLYQESEGIGIQGLKVPVGSSDQNSGVNGSNEGLNSSSGSSGLNSEALNSSSAALNSCPTGIEPRKALRPFTFIFVGRIVGDKGVNELVEAFTQLHEEYENTKLVLVGPYEEHLDPVSELTLNRIKTNPAIDAVGKKFGDDLLLEYLKADCHVLPSYREGFPNTPMEAGAMGLPNIVTDINGSREIVGNFNANLNPNVNLNASGIKICDNGIIVPPRTVQPLYAAMERMLTDTAMREKMKQNARPMIESRFERSFVRKCLYDFYDEILK